MKYGNLNILDTAKYDIMALGALVTRFDPGNIPFREAKSEVSRIDLSLNQPFADVIARLGR